MDLHCLSLVTHNHEKSGVLATLASLALPLEFAFFLQDQAQKARKECNGHHSLGAARGAAIGGRGNVKRDRFSQGVNTDTYQKHVHLSSHINFNQSCTNYHQFQTLRPLGKMLRKPRSKKLKKTRNVGN